MKSGQFMICRDDETIEYVPPMQPTPLMIEAGALEISHSCGLRMDFARIVAKEVYCEMVRKAFAT